ncbi:MAG: hypothetical protein IJ859_06880 [Synergistaceae bacterium]|nr:hypothetical protein [Synergistaceae bacterium]
MKKMLVLVLVAFYSAIYLSPCFAFYENFNSQKAERFNKKMEALTKNFSEFASKIVNFNKPIFEVRLTRKEREYTEWGEDDKPLLSKVEWNRVYAKDKTLVLAYSWREKKFGTLIFKTNDPNFDFRGLRVGADVKVLEKFFGDSIRNIGHVKGNSVTIYGPYYGPSGELPETLSIICVDGIITEFIYDLGFGITRDGLISKKAVNFAEKTAKEMGLSSLNGGLPTYFNEKELVTFFTDPNKN